MKPTTVHLPKLARRFLATPDGRYGRPTIRLFHSWLQRHERALGALTHEDVERFLENPADNEILATTRNGYRSILFRYLDWLHRHRAIAFDSAWLRIRRQLLPDCAESYLLSLKPTLRPSTCNGYRTALRLFHNWLEEQGLALETLSRQQVSQWLQHLYAERKQAPATRVNVIVAVRTYMRALNDSGLLRANADELIRASDLPKLPVYLPRPIAPDADEELRRRLASSEDPRQRALLVMRNTGLRVGEVCGLSYDCVRHDELGNTFLKVPLGKLNTERLVPMDADTLAEVERLRQSGREGREYLIESVTGRKLQRDQLQVALAEAGEGLEIPNGLTTHRLRHTYATTMLNAGMSLVGVMKLLGHRDYRMTLRYTEITLETVGKEYRAALTQLETRYRIAITSPAEEALDPDEALSDLILWIQKRAGESPEQQRKASALVKRLKRIREEVGSL